jgi:hypothetical protein
LKLKVLSFTNISEASYKNQQKPHKKKNNSKPINAKSNRNSLDIKTNK